MGRIEPAPADHESGKAIPLLETKQHPGGTNAVVAIENVNGGEKNKVRAIAF